MALASRLWGQGVLPLDLTELSLDELGAISISAASKHAQPLFETPAAVTVLLSDEIRRYGYSTVADALRAAPGVNVTAVDNAHWSAGVRGFNGITSTKLLVLVDGRNIYSPMYGSVAWAKANIPLEDLDRIEVVRGPGSSVWGANAVNGIVSVVSKDAHATQGNLVSVRESVVEGLQLYARHGGQLNDHTFYRVYLRTSDTSRGFDPWPDTTEPNLREITTGFRVDQSFHDTLRFTWQADYLVQHYDTGYVDPATTTAYHGVGSFHTFSAIGRMVWRDAEAQDLTVQAYFDYDDGNVSSAGYRGLSGGAFGTAEDGRNFDLDVTHHLALGSQDLIWGGGFRNTLVDVDENAQIQLRRPRFTQNRYNLFVQDDISVVEKQLRLTLGSKLERHHTVGWQLLPTARLTYTPTPHQTFWAAVSRSVRSPSGVERDVRIPFAAIPGSPTSLPVRVDLVADGTLNEETLIAYEAGWRWAPHPRLTVDVTGYDNDYDRLRNLRPSYHVETNPPTLVNDLTLYNGTDARGYGAEASVQWRPSDRLRFAATYSLEYLKPETSQLYAATAQDFALPKKMWSVRSAFEVVRDVEASCVLNYVDSVEELGVRSYYRFDAQLTWRPKPEWEFNLGVQNAFDSKHEEFGAISVYTAAEAQRNYYARVQWRF